MTEDDANLLSWLTIVETRIPGVVEQLEQTENNGPPLTVDQRHDLAVALRAAANLLNPLPTPTVAPQDTPHPTRDWVVRLLPAAVGIVVGGCAGAGLAVWALT